MKKVAYLTNAGPHSGVGHRAERIAQLLADHHADQVNLTTYAIDGSSGIVRQDQQRLLAHHQLPGLLGSKTVSWLALGFRLRRHLNRLPDTIWHATNQTLSFITTRRHPAVVTVHDLIELIDPQSRLGGVAARYLYSGIKRASHIIAVSAYTAQTIEERLGIPASKITVIPNGVGPEFHPIADFAQSIRAATLRQELRLGEGQRVVLCVSSDHPRKNSITALRAFAQARRQDPHLIFVKVGAAGLPAGRVALLEEIDRLHLREHVRLLQNVSPDHLNELYNAAAVFIFPSRFEGFGLPPLQAMAAGTPVIASRATSLPEVVGTAGILHDPDDVAAFAQSIDEVVHNNERASQLREQGPARARQFSWEKAAAAEVAVYQRM